MQLNPLRYSAAAAAALFLTLTPLGCGAGDDPASGSNPSTPTTASTAATSPPPADVAQLTAIQSAIDEDKRIGEWFLEQAGAPGIDRQGLILVAHDRMADIDLTACPRDFSDAYASHVAAWADAVAALAAAADPSGSADFLMRSLFGDPRAAAALAADQPRLKSALDAIQRTSSSYLDRAERHGATIDLQVILR